MMQGSMVLENTRAYVNVVLRVQLDMKIVKRSEQFLWVAGLNI